MSEENALSLGFRRSRGLSRLLLLARRNFVAAVAEIIEQAGYPALPDASLMLLPHIDLEGTRGTDIALRAGMTKQAVTQLIRQMETAGLVEKVTDPSDARATLVSFTEFGRAYLTEMHTAIDTVEGDLRHGLGDENIEIFRQTLQVMAYHWPQSEEALAMELPEP